MGSGPQKQQISSETKHWEIRDPPTKHPWEYTHLLQRDEKVFLLDHPAIWSSLTTHLLTWAWPSPVLDTASLTVYKTKSPSQTPLFKREQANASFIGNHQGPTFHFYFWGFVKLT